MQEASKPIDISGVMPNGLPPKSTEQPINEESKNIDQNPVKKLGPPTMKIYIDKEGFVTFPDGSRYKGGL